MFFLVADWIYLITFSFVGFVFKWAVDLYNLLGEIRSLLRSFFITCFDVAVYISGKQSPLVQSFDNISLFQSLTHAGLLVHRTVLL